MTFHAVEWDYASGPAPVAVVGHIVECMRSNRRGDKWTPAAFHPMTNSDALLLVMTMLLDSNDGKKLNRAHLLLACCGAPTAMGENMMATAIDVLTQLEVYDDEPVECPYCGGDCPSHLPNSENLCDGFAGDIDGLSDE